MPARDADMFPLLRRVPPFTQWKVGGKSLQCATCCASKGRRPVFMCNNILFIYEHYYYYCITDVPSDSSNGLIRFSLVSQSIIIMVTVDSQLYSPRLWYHKLVSYAIPDVFSKCQDNRAHNHVLNLLYTSKCDQNLQSVCLFHVILCTICTYHPRLDSSTCGADCIFFSLSLSLSPPPSPPPPPFFFLFFFLSFFFSFLSFFLSIVRCM